MLARLGKCPGSALAGVAWDVTGTRGMRRHDERSAADTRTVRRGATRRALATLALVLTSAGMIPWAGAVPDAMAAVSPDSDSIIAAAQNETRGQANVIAEPLYVRAPVALKQQDAEDATAGATGANGTVNGVPRDATEVAPVTTGPGAPLAPGDVMLPPSVPALPAPGVDSAVTGAIGAPPK